ncbi:MAG: winged helix-turn-helix transcriptional regulator [Eggerthellaceae bacterium]|nr:winged helix-turn-helix transcriptional regulator [Eggerthellaceae bacterium]
MEHNKRTHEPSSIAEPNPHTPECCDHVALEISGMPEEEMLYDLADLFKVFSDTTRIKILFALMDQDLCVAHITEAVGATQSAVSHQLRILKQARLVRFHREGKNMVYSLADDHVHTILAQGMSHICE